MGGQPIVGNTNRALAPHVWMTRHSTLDQRVWSQVGPAALSWIEMSPFEAARGFGRLKPAAVIGIDQGQIIERQCNASRAMGQPT
jgi:hypothetical protein